jgi:hypothetical protein
VGAAYARAFEFEKPRGRLTNRRIARRAVFLSYCIQLLSLFEFDI